MANAKEIQDRMKSINDTLKITNAMYMISSSKLKKSKKMLTDTEPYFFTLQSEMSRILRHLPDLDSIYFRSTDEIPEEEKRIAYMVVTADKGLAGSYNHNILKIAEEELANTLVATDYKDPPIINDEVEENYIVRRLTPTECARLQGFPDWWCEDLGTPEPTDEDIAYWKDVFEDCRNCTYGTRILM